MSTLEKCKNCGADEGLHHYKTMACPVGGREAPVNRPQEYMDGYHFEVQDNSAEKIAILTSALESLAKGMITKPEFVKVLAQTTLEQVRQL